MTRVYSLGLRILTVLLILLPIGLWAWTAMSVTLVCALDESSSACTAPNSALAQIGFLKLAIVPWVLAAVCSHFVKRLAARQGKRTWQ